MLGESSELLERERADNIQFGLYVKGFKTLRLLILIMPNIYRTTYKVLSFINLVFNFDSYTVKIILRFSRIVPV